MKIAIGPVFEDCGGLSQHIFAIRKFSTHNVVETPSKTIRAVLSNNLQKRKLYKMLMNKIGLRNYDVIHSHADPWFTNLCQDLRKHTAKWVHTYHTLHFEEDYSKGLKKWQNEVNKALLEIAPKADVRISVSKWLHNYLLDNYAIQTEVIPNGVDLEHCKNAKANRFVENHSLQDFVLFVGGIRPIKNPAFFVELARQMPETKFVMMGRNLDETNLKKKYGIWAPENLVMMNELEHEEALDAMSACKALVMTSKREGLPTVLLEAMALGKPVVAPKHSGCKEIIQSREYGFMYQPGSLDELVKKTEQALKSKHVGKRAQSMVVKKYDWKILAKRIDSVYESSN